jgi:hypothetical protein
VAGIVTPPRKRAGVATGPRRIDGEALDVAGGAAMIGLTVKAIRARVARGLLPHRRMNGRIILLRSELLAYLQQLPGVTLSEALANRARRPGRPTRAGVTTTPQGERPA